MDTKPKRAVVGSVKWPESGGYPIVYVEKNGTVRELTAKEREYLETPFSIDDGERPYVMSTYRPRAWWQLRRDLGFCPRHLIPEGIRIPPAGS